jgi:reverse gyrase
LKTEKCINCRKTFNSDDLERGLCEWCLEYRDSRGDKYEEEN